ncbi:uncharacterized protein DEA37_0011296 [Paragonimus westermani]|uniref:CTF/NF-I domain-containing protein n=1 Tax=Paragonimus westermani TaxID=34504 RepID=A0A5J4P2C6_9TREM|nr:uncharacterized protein DEA37_0011296 [Paragonimus westermani]
MNFTNLFTIPELRIPVIAPLPVPRSSMRSKAKIKRLPLIEPQLASDPKEMDAAAETDAVANLLKKLYKELPTDSVFWFLKCWLCSEDSVRDPDSCVISRGDAKGRMRRIDGGKGSDKVWRLDTIVGMLYHGLPMSSTDTNIMVHTCDQELCVRPQHIRFRASSVALVVVLKALAQAGYTVIPPPVAAGPNGVAPNASDESVDVFGPFNIDELQQYRSENLVPGEESSNKLTLSNADRELAESVPVLRAALQLDGTDVSTLVSTQTMNTVAQMNGFSSIAKNFKIEGHFNSVNQLTSSESVSPRATITAADFSRSTLTRLPLLPPHYRETLAASVPEPLVDVKPPLSGLPASPNPPVFPPAGPLPPPIRLDRRSLKRPAPTDSPCSFSSSPVHSLSHLQSSNSPPLLIPDPSPTPVSHYPVPLRNHPQHSRLSESVLSTHVLIPMATTTIAPSCMLSSTDPTLSSGPNTMLSIASSSLHNLTDKSVVDVFLPTTIGTQVSDYLDPLHSHSHLHHLYQPPMLTSEPQHLHHHSIMHPSSKSSFQTRLAQICPVSGVSLSPSHVYQPYAVHQPPAQSTVSAPCPNPNPTITLGLGAFSVGQSVTSNGNSCGQSNSGKTTPRQPAKKRLEARTPTIDGDVGDEIATSALVSGIGSGSSHSTTPNMLEEYSLSVPSALGASSFRVHQNTPFVPVQSRSGRPSSSGSSSSAGGFLPTTGLPVTRTATDLRKLSGHTDVSANPDGEAKEGEGEAEDEDEEEEELRDIMVKRSGSSVLHTPTDSDKTGSMVHSARTTTAISALNKNLAAVGGVKTGYPELGRSPTCERRAIEMIGALLASAYGSPLLVSSATPYNSRRSASACSLPFVGTSPNENSLDPGSLVVQTNNISRYGSPVGTANPDWLSDQRFLSANLPGGAPGSSILGKSSQLNISNTQPTKSGFSAKSFATTLTTTRTLTPPPPQLTPAVAGSATEGFRWHGDSRGAPAAFSNLQPLSFNKDLNSGQEIVNLIRNSPASAITPELIDMLYNMAQQYGMPRIGSRASRELLVFLRHLGTLLMLVADQISVRLQTHLSTSECSPSQVAQNLYRSLVNGSVCGSPFQAGSLPSMNNGSIGCSLASTGTAVANDSSSGSTGPTVTGSSNANKSCSSSFSFSSPSNTTISNSNCCPFFSVTMPQNTHPVHQLRCLSFTPLSVDSEPVVTVSNQNNFSSQWTGKPTAPQSPIASQPLIPVTSAYASNEDNGHGHW